MNEVFEKDNIVYTKALKFYKVIKVHEHTVTCENDEGIKVVLLKRAIKGLPAFLQKQSD